MKIILHKIASFLMALIVFFSTSSFTIDKHFCGDVLVDSSIFNEAKPCDMELQNSTDSEGCSMKDDCCRDEQIIVHGHNDLKTSVVKINLEQQIFVASFIYSYINLFEDIQTDKNSFRDYSPPPLVRDIQVLDQTFLI